MRPISRRQVLQGGAAAGAMLLARPSGALAGPLGPTDHYGTSRASRLDPTRLLVHADLHNHTLLSDGDGEASEAFASMRSQGLDVAALTDHATVNDGLPESVCLPASLLDQGAHAECMALAGMHEGSWQVSAELARANSVDDEFVAIRGFEWSSPTLGHMNVWFSQEFTDPLHTGGLGTPADLARFATAEGFPAPTEVVAALSELVDATPAAGAGMAGWFEWLKLAPSTPGLGGGADGIFGFNHPGREAGRFGDWAFDAALVDRCVGLELFNRRDDYLFERTDDLGLTSPLVACLDAGWKPGLTGVTDEHGTDWGAPDGKGRTGVYVRELTADGVREALLARRVFATNLKGLRIDATANGVPMGSTLGHRSGPVTFVLDVDRGRDWWGRELVVQVLATGTPLPTVVDERTVTVPRGGQPPIRFTVPHDVADGRWLVLRVCDPDPASRDPRAPSGWSTAGGAMAYTSPFHLDPDATPGSGAAPTGATSTIAAPASGVRAAAATPTTTVPLPTTGGGAGAAAAAIVGAALLRLRGRGEGH